MGILLGFSILSIFDVISKWVWKYESFVDEIFKIDVVKEVFYQCMKINVN